MTRIETFKRLFPGCELTWRGWPAEDCPREILGEYKCPNIGGRYGTLSVWVVGKTFWNEEVQI